MTDEKRSPETLDLRARPRPVTRLNRKVLIGVSGTGIILICVAAIYALQPPSLKTADSNELYNVQSREKPESLAALPKSYNDYTPPLLGAPLPGELGNAVLDTERRAGLEPQAITPGALPFRHDPLTDTERAERIRLAQRAQQSRESSVFFQLSQTAQTRTNTPDASDPLHDVLSAVSTPTPESLTDTAPGLGQGGTFDPGQQGRKNEFLARGPDDAIYNPHQMQTPVSPYQVMAGTIIAASLITGLNADLPGQVIAQVTQPVYDSVTGTRVLIPQGTRLLGTYDSMVAFGQERALVVWQRLIMPDGSSILIDNLPATDTAGFAGLKDKVDFHTGRILKGVGLSTLLNIGTELAFDDDDSDLSRALERGTQQSISRTGEQIVDRFLNVQPTITIRPGTPLRVIVHKDIVLRPFLHRKAQP